MSNLNKRQFIICNREIKKENFLSKKISEEMIISFHKDLNLKEIDCGNHRAYLLGHAFQVNYNKKNPEEEIKNAINIEEVIASFSGRWILIFKEKLYMDACGTLGCFYHHSESNKAIISSSLSLINELINSPKMNYKEIKHGEGINWYPAPLTIYEEINRLLPSEILNFKNGNLKKEKETRKIKLIKNISDEKKIEIFSEYMITLIKNIKTNYDGKIILPLTAGYDSRTLLALLLKSEINFETYTMEHENISLSDIKIPKKIVNDFKLNHKYIKRTGKINKDKLKEFDKHTEGYSMDADRLFYAYNQYDEMTEKAMLLRGGIWEVAREFYWDKLIKDGTIEEKENSLKTAFENIEYSQQHKQSLKIWLEESIELSEDMDWRDRFYLDQRVSGWMSSIEQSLDITELDRIHPLNSKVLIEILMSISKEARENGKHQSEIMKKNYSDVLNYPFNKKSFFEKLNYKIIKKFAKK